MTDKRDNRDISEELSLLKDKLRKNEQLFNLAEEEAVIEALVFERKAIMLRYGAALKKAKECKAAFGEEQSGKGELKWRK
ncbi:MAG: hypothetical protein ACI4J4_08675 [Ruminiclostridium sp.]